MKKILILGNAITDHIKFIRNIDTDSQAATNKILQLAKLLTNLNYDVGVLSYGRGAPNGVKLFGSNINSEDGIRIVFFPYSQRFYLSYILSIFSPAIYLFKYAFIRSKILIVYNRHPLHFMALLVAKLLNFQIILELEDGEIHIKNMKLLKRILNNFYIYIIDKIIFEKVLITCSGLLNCTAIKKSLIYYGFVVPRKVARKFITNEINILMNASIGVDMGENILLQAIEILNGKRLKRKIIINVTGKFITPCNISNNLLEVKIFGKLPKDEYINLLQKCDVGLSLRPINGILADNTFPSKIIEFLSYGLLVIATNVSDVRRLLIGGAYILESNSPKILADILAGISCDVSDAMAKLAYANQCIVPSLSEGRQSQMLLQFIES